MQRKSETRKKRCLVGDSGDAVKLPDEIESLTDALYTKKPSEIRQRTISTKKSPNAEPRSKPKALADEKRSSSSSIWNWKPLRALSHIRHRRFDCRFTLQVHSVLGLSHGFNGAALCVRWKRNLAELGLCTRHAIVSQGSANFVDTLEHRCGVYGIRSGGPHHTAKYEARHFIVYASIVGKPEIDLGKHHVDLTRLLPLTLEELEDGSSGKWSTCFKLSGKGKNACLNVSFGFSVLDNGDRQDSGDRKKIEPDDNSALVKSGGVPFHSRPYRCTVVTPMAMSEDVHENESKIGADEAKQSLELALTETGKTCTETDDHELEISAEKEVVKNEEHWTASDRYGKNLRCDEEREKVSVITADGVFSNRDVRCTNRDAGDWREENETDDEDVVDSKVDAWTNNNGIVGREHGKFSIRDAEDWREDEDNAAAADDDDDDDYHVKERAEVQTDSANNVERQECRTDSEEDKDGDENDGDEDIDAFLSQIHESDREMPVYELNYQEENLSDSELFLHELESAMESQSLEEQSHGELNYVDDASESVASEFLSMLELEDSDPESPRERLWQEFKNESSLDLESIFDHDLKDFDLSSFIEDAEADVLEVESWGRVLEEEEAEALMGELGFKEISVANSPVDCSFKEVGPLLRTKDGGFLRSMNPSLMMQVSNPVVVPAEMGSSAMEILESLASVGIEKLSVQASQLMPLEDITGKTISQISSEPHVSSTRMNERKCKRRASSADDNYVSLEELAPLAMEKIEALSIEGLKIQSSMSGRDSPVDLGHDGAIGLHLHKVNASGREVDGLVGLSVSLEEWIKLDSGKIREDQINERTAKILSAHQAKRENPYRRKGIFGNKFIVALMVQLRNPKRNFEPVGTPMLSLIQVERVFVNPKPRFCYTVSDEGNSEEAEVNVSKAKTAKDEVNAFEPQFKITGVHVAGLQSNPSERMMRGSSSQRQAGSRWLAANGMGKFNKNPLMKSTPGETLWSISSMVNARGSRWSELSAYKRNPNILLPK